MVVELATILLGAAAGVALVLYAAPKGLFGHSRKKAVSVAVKPPTKTYTPPTEAVTEVKVAVAPPAPEPAPSPAPTPSPAIYETVQPETTPPPTALPAPTSSAVTFGAPVPHRTSRTYRRRTAPSRSASVKAGRTREKKS